MKKVLIITFLLFGAALFLASFISVKANNNNNRAGCCSHHSGVCGCSGTRAKCCDGSTSPSCGC